MKRLLFALFLSITVLVFTVIWAAPSLAQTAAPQTAQERIITALHSEGYTVLQQERTFLGRMWLLVENDTLRREIVFNPGTGEILRDYSVLLASLDAQQRQRRNAAGNVISSTAATTTLTTTSPLGNSITSSSPALPDVISPVEPN